MPIDLTPERGLLFRITHVRNLPWLLANGLACSSDGAADPVFVAIGNSDLIEGRSRHLVPLAPLGTLADYVPFYLTPKSPMLFNIKTGYNGVQRRPNSDIAILVSDLGTLQGVGVKLLYTDRHAFMRTARWSDDRDDLVSMIDWDILRRHDFARSDSYPDKMDRYQAEVLAYRHVPVSGLRAIGCADVKAQADIQNLVDAANLALQVIVRPSWYFS